MHSLPGGILAISICEITPLDHELFDDTVKSRALVSKTFLARGQFAEVLCSLGHGFPVKAHDDSSERLIAVSDIEVDLVGNFGTFRGFRCLGHEEEACREHQQQRDHYFLQIRHIKEHQVTDGEGWGILEPRVSAMFEEAGERCPVQPREPYWAHL